MSASRLQRALRIITLVQGGQARTSEGLCEELKVGRRTLFRDLEVLRQAGVPCYYKPGSGYRIARSFFFSPAKLTVTETLGLMLMGKVAYAQRTGPLKAEAASAVAKIVATVPQEMRSVCEELMATVLVAAEPDVVATGKKQHFLTLQQYIEEGRACLVTQRSLPGEVPHQTVLHPYALHLLEPGWFVLGLDRNHDALSLIKLSRVDQVSPTDILFTRPKGGAIPDVVGKAWRVMPEGKIYKVEVVFSGEVAACISETRWHESQTDRRLPDGRRLVTFEVDGLTEIARWVCGFGPDIVVRKPVELKQRVAQLLRDALKPYDSKKER